MGNSRGTVAGPKLNGALSEELLAAAKEAGLQYVSDERPGYTRKPKGKHFEYFDTEGKPIRDEQRLVRIKRMAIPPAWTDVWICPSPNGHVQATGRDARGRKQYRYHERWREMRDENKFDRLAQFAKVLPNIRRQVAQDLKLPGLPRRKVLATIVRLLERTFIRIPVARRLDRRGHHCDPFWDWQMAARFVPGQRRCRFGLRSGQFFDHAIAVGLLLIANPAVRR